MKICIIGTGYVGLVTGTCLAEVGNEVVCIDVDGQKINQLKQGILPIYEPNLEPLVKSNYAKGRLQFSTSLAKEINQSEVTFLAVGTPPNEDGSADLQHVLEVAHQIAKVASKKIILGTKSTVPVGTGDKIENILKEHSKFPFIVFSNPEFLKEGNAVNDFMKPNRVIIGLDNHEIRDKLRELYAPFTRKSDRLLFMSRKTAELTKYAANAMLATRISFINEMANLCEKLGADIHDLRQGLGSDPRIGPDFLFPSMGYGGSCFPKDVKALLKTAQNVEMPLRLVKACEEVNNFQKELLFQKIVRHFGGTEKLKGKKFALWGGSFKAKTDDIRESPALSLIDQLLQTGAIIAVHDPEAINNIKKIYGAKLTYCADHYECIEGSCALIIATEWNEYRSPYYECIKEKLLEPVIFDGRNILDVHHLKKLGFQYYGIGIKI